MLLFYLSLIETEEDKSKFERLYNSHKNLLKHIATNILRDEFLAEDAVHEAFIKLTRYIDGVDENNVNKTKSFIVLIVRSVCFDMIRKNKKYKTICLDEIEDLVSVYDVTYKDIEANDIYAIISSLPETYREIVQLKVHYNLSDKEIADIVCISNSSVRKRIQRAREILKNKLAELGDDYVYFKNI